MDFDFHDADGIDGFGSTEGYIVASNLPGCLPDSEPHTFSSWSEAKESLLHDLNEAANVHLEGLSVWSDEFLSAERAWNTHLHLVETFKLEGQPMAVTAPDGYRYYLERMV